MSNIHLRDQPALRSDWIKGTMELTFDSIANLLKTNPWVAFAMVLIAVIWKYGPAMGKTVADYFKEYMAQKHDNMTKMLDSLDVNSTRFYTLVENQGKTMVTLTDKMVVAIDKVGDGINSMEKALIASEGRLMERISGLGNMVTEEIRDSKFDTLIKLNKPEASGESKAKSHGDNK